MVCLDENCVSCKTLQTLVVSSTNVKYMIWIDFIIMENKNCVYCNANPIYLIYDDNELILQVHKTKSH